MRFFFLLLVTLTISGCAAPVVYDFDSSANFQKDHTIAFEETKEGNIQSLDRTRIHESITYQLEMRGFKVVDKSAASLIVRYQIEEEIRVQSSGMSYGVGVSRNRMGMSMQTPVNSREIKEGKLVVEIVEPEGSRVIWRAVSQKKLTEQMKPDKRSELINELTQDMFENYPPKKQ